ncbi:MAG: DUF559 domain-containing protein [Phenylobacterium sp.]|nr:DUF559 domain-containing protein [Phenylobacterium sp.]
MMPNRTSTRIATRARALRKSMTEPEVMLWSRLKGRGQERPVFRRQYAYESMIFDFYCPAARLAVEIDGATHWSEEAQAKDYARDRWLATRNIAVLRLGAGQVYQDVGGAADAAILLAEARIRQRQASRDLPFPFHGKGGPLADPGAGGGKSVGWDGYAAGRTGGWRPLSETGWAWDDAFPSHHPLFGLRPRRAVPPSRWREGKPTPGRGGLVAGPRRRR